jgi:hypothetical protein
MVKEADLLAGANKKKRSAAMAQVFANCWEETIDHGIYDDPLDWDQVLQGDRTFLLLAIRTATHGPEYVFKPQCPSPGCLRRFEWSIDLREGLNVRTLTEASKAKFKAGNQFVAIIPSTGEKVTYRLPVGLDEKRAALMQQQGKQQLLTLSLRMRIDAIEGVETQNIRKFLGGMQLSDANALLEQFDENDCGVDTRIEVECDTCSTEFDVELPFDQGFFFPSRARQSARKAAV